MVKLACSTCNAGINSPRDAACDFKCVFLPFAGPRSPATATLGDSCHSVDLKRSSPLIAGIGGEGTWAAANDTYEGLGVDPVFQRYSYLWDLDLDGEEQQYYNMTQVVQSMRPVPKS